MAGFAHDNDVARIDAVEPADDVEHRAFASPAFPKDEDKSFLPESDADVIKCFD